MNENLCDDTTTQLEKSKQFDFFQFFKFALVGASNTVISYLVYLGLLLLLQHYELIPDTDYLLSQWIGYVVSIFWAFILNKKFVFENTKKKWYISLVKTFIAYSLTGIVLSSILLYVEVNVFEMSKVVAPIINIAICLPINYLINKHWAF